MEKTRKNNPYLEGDRDTFIEKNLRLVHSVVQRMTRQLSAAGIEYADGVSIGTIGLIKAYDNFNPEKYNTKFSTYAVPLISGEILKAIRDQGNRGGINVSRIVKEVSKKIYFSGKEYKSYKEIMEDFGINKRLAIEVLDSIHGKINTISSNMPLYEGEDKNELTVGDMIGREADFSSIFSEEFIRNLDPTEQKVISYLLEDKTQEEIGINIGVSQVQVSRIIKRIREKAELYFEKGITIKNKKSRKRREVEVVNSGVESRMIEKGYKKLLNLLKNTDKSYKEIAEMLNMAYSTVAYYGKQIRTVEQRKRIRRKIVNKSNDTIRKKKFQTPDVSSTPSKAETEKEQSQKVEEKEQSQKVEEKEQLKTTMVLNSKGSEVTVEELRNTIEKLISTINYCNGKITDFNVELKVEA